MRRWLIEIIRPKADTPPIRLIRDRTKADNANSYIRFGKHTWSLVPAGRHRKRTPSDVAVLHAELREAMRFGDIVTGDAE